MKTLKVTIQLDMSVPDSWELVQTSEGTPVIRMPGGTYLDLAIEPLYAADPEGSWSGTTSDEELEEFLDMVDSEEVSYEFVAR
ncbi:MAG: hypothetical protein VW475_14760 [Curvibacter sp.]